jgi:hypothetical protein
MTRTKTKPRYGDNYTKGYEDGVERGKELTFGRQEDFTYFHFVDWLLYNIVTLVVGVGIFVILFLTWQFIHWAAQQDHVSYYQGSSMTVLPSNCYWNSNGNVECH